MNTFIKIDRMQKLHHLILNYSTGTPQELADKLSISRSSLYNLLDELKSFDLPITYCKVRQTFYYTKQVEFNLQCSIKIIDEKEILRNINGGDCLFSLPSILLDRTLLYLYP